MVTGVESMCQQTAHRYEKWIILKSRGYRSQGAPKNVLSNRGLGIKANKCLYEGVIGPTALYGAKAWGLRSVERRKVNVLEMKCLRSLVGVSRMDKIHSMNQSINIRFIQKGTLQRTSKYSYSIYMNKTDLLTCHQDLVRAGCYYTILT